jgi:hypothetical protein
MYVQLACHLPLPKPSLSLCPSLWVSLSPPIMSLQFQVYNSILRRWPTDLYELFKSYKNLFSTTIHVLVSAVQKLSRQIRIPDGTLLYRGLGGKMDLPDSFSQPDERGGRGYAEWAFMSTTAKREIALQYSGVKEGLPRAMVLVIQTGAVDRGACLREYSQYPGEDEYLWLPLSFLQPNGRRSVQVVEGGVVDLIPVRVIPNLKTATLEEALTRKRTMHVSAFRFLLSEVFYELRQAAREESARARLLRDPSRRTQLARAILAPWESQAEGSEANRFTEYTVQNLVENIEEQCNERLLEHERLEVEEFTSDEVYRGLVIEMLDVRTMACSKFDSWLRDDSELIDNVCKRTLRDAHRGWTAFLKRQMPTDDCKERRSTALSVCLLRGLLRKDVHETNESGETRLVSAAADGAGAEDILLLIAAGAEINPEQSNLKTPLIAAASSGHKEAVLALIGARSAVNATGKVRLRCHHYQGINTIATMGHSQ